MSRFSGRQGDGAVKRARKQRREEAEARANYDPEVVRLLQEISAQHDDESDEGVDL